MLLPFSEKFKWNGQPTHFERKIADKNPSKFHTFREGERFKPGHLLHFWINNPRVKKYKPAWSFDIQYSNAAYWANKKKNDLVVSGALLERADRIVEPENLLPIVYAVERFQMQINKYDDCIQMLLNIGSLYWDVRLIESDADQIYDETDYTEGGKIMFRFLAMNDGLTASDFVRWFYHQSVKNKSDEIVGQLIHWTDAHIYDEENALIYVL